MQILIKRKPKDNQHEILELRSEMKNSLEQHRGRFEQAEEWMNKRADWRMESIKSKEQKEKRLKKSWQGQRDLRDTLKQIYALWESH